MQDRNRSYLLWLLSRQNYSRQKLMQKLSKRGLSKEEAKDLIDQLAADGYFKEEAYAQSRTRSLLRKGLGSRLVLSKLKSEGCASDSEKVREVLEDLNLSPAEQLKSLFDKALKKHGSPSDQKSKQKIIRFLMSKGHDVQAILKILKT